MEQPFLCWSLEYEFTVYTTPVWRFPLCTNQIKLLQSQFSISFHYGTIPLTLVEKQIVFFSSHRRQLWNVEKMGENASVRKTKNRPWGSWNWWPPGLGEEKKRSVGAFGWEATAFFTTFSLQWIIDYRYFALQLTIVWIHFAFRCERREFGGNFRLETWDLSYWTSVSKLLLYGVMKC